MLLFFFVSYNLFSLDKVCNWVDWNLSKSRIGKMEDFEWRSVFAESIYTHLNLAVAMGSSPVASSGADCMKINVDGAFVTQPPCSMCW